MRLIDADDLLERVGRERLDTRERIREMVLNAPTIEPQKWISITDTEPGAAHVLATLRWDEDDYEVTELDYWATVAAQDDKDKVISARARDIIEHVIAWMPLPEAYKE